MVLSMLPLAREAHAASYYRSMVIVMNMMVVLPHVKAFIIMTLAQTTNVSEASQLPADCSSDVL